MNQTPLVKDVILVGGGHSHVLLIRRWAMRPIAGVRLTLISIDAQSPYSGMLPGLIAGHYTADEIHVDLYRLCSWANVRFIEATVSALDLDQKQVCFASRPPLGFDLLSLDTGSTPDLSVAGAAQNVTPVKPVSNFYSRWQALLARVKHSNSDSFSIGVVGSGAGGFELVTAMRHALPVEKAQCYWFLRNEYALGGRSEKVGLKAISAATAAGIHVVKNFNVQSVEPGLVRAADGRSCSLDEILWCTAAIGPKWPLDAGLDTDSRGFVATNAYLQSISHPYVFATGDIGTQINTPSAKAGVFAVRQAPILFANIRHLLLGEPLEIYKPQSDFLSLMATGGKRAIASRGPFVVEGDWVWRWKDHIDQTFMRKFQNLPLHEMNASLARLPNALRQTNVEENGFESLLPARPNVFQCRGCGAKVGQDVLQRVIEKTRSEKQYQRDVVLSPAVDNAVLKLETGLLAQSVDQISAIIDDPYMFGRIATLHALSDVVTVDSKLHSAQVLITLPHADEQIIERDLTQLMRGVLDVLDEEGCALLGGHTVQGAEMSLGLVVNATVAEPAELNLPQAQPGDVLILTKALGNGVLFAGLMQGLTRGPDIIAALPDMLMSNQSAAAIFREHQCRMITDVTGFGLLGHLESLFHPGSAGARLSLSSIVFAQGAQNLASLGCRSSLWSQNSKVLNRIELSKNLDMVALSLLCDPQTSGGLLAVVPAAYRDACLHSLVESGCSQATAIGIVDATGEITVEQ